MKLKTFLRIPPVADCGVGYYRQWLPLKTAEDKKKLEMKCLNFSFGERNDESGNAFKDPTVDEISKVVRWADIMYYARNDVPQYIAEAGGVRDFYIETQQIYKPLVLDIDDNIHATRPYNPGYRSFHPNSMNNVWNVKSLGVFDALTVSTENLKNWYSNHTDRPIYVCPNSLDWKERDDVLKMDFKNSDLFKKKPGEIRLGWTGSAAHWENLKHIEPVIYKILDNFPQTTFYLTGLFGDLFSNQKYIQEGRIVSTPWAKLKKWPILNREVNFDIALAPLCDNDFNRAKSNLRLLEYASAKFPVICSPVEPYKTFSNKEVVFATEKDEWYDAIEDLIKNEDKRKNLSEALYTRAKKEYNIDKNYKIWLNALTEIYEKSQKAFKNSLKKR